MVEILNLTITKNSHINSHTLGSPWPRLSAFCVFVGRSFIHIFSSAAVRRASQAARQPDGKNDHGDEATERPGEILMQLESAPIA